MDDFSIINDKKEGTVPSKPECNDDAWGRYGLTEDIWSLMEKGWHMQPNSRPSASALVSTMTDLLVLGKIVDRRPPSEDLALETNFSRSWSAGPCDGLVRHINQPSPRIIHFLKLCNF
jgi:hypothetical protein